MGFGELMLLAVGVSMDAFAVSICKGLAMKKATLKAGLTCGVWFGGFQALMPLIGFFLGTLFAEAIEAVDHWVAFVLLGIIGFNMLNISKALFLADVVVVSLSAFVFSVEVWLYCVVGFLSRMLVVNNVIESMNTSKYFTIITSREKEISDYITEVLEHGATVSDSFVGVYSGEQKTVILTVVRRRNAVALRHHIKEIDPDAFVIINNSMDIIGNGFREII